MRRLHGGLLAAALLFTAGCGSGEKADGGAAGSETTSIRTPTLAVTTQAIAASRASDLTSTVLVTSPEGVSSPGLDAAVSVLLERPDVTVVVVAPDGADGPISGAPSPEIRQGQTMSGFPAHVVEGRADDAVGAAVALGLEPDLVVVGFVEGAVLGSGIATSAVAGAMRAASSHEIPALAVTVGTDHGADLAAAGLMLRSMLDVDVATLLSPGGRVLTVPSCDGGLVRGPVATVASGDASAAPAVDCGNVATADPADDVEAHSDGFATLVELRP